MKLYYKNKNAFVESQTEQLLTGYRRDLQINQPEHLELWTTNERLVEECQDIARRYSIEIISIGEYTYLPLLCNEAHGRIKANYKNGQRTKILYVADLSLDGWALLLAIINTLHQQMKLMDMVNCERCALNPEQVKKYELPYSSLEKLKVSDSRKSDYIEIFGDMILELNEISPEILEILIKEAIEENLNMETFREQREIEAFEINEIAVLKGEVNKAVKIYTKDW